MSVDINNIKYDANISLIFNYNGILEQIDTEKIAYVYFDYDYQDNNLPIAYVSLIVNNTLYKNINQYKDTASFILTINRANFEDSNIALGKKILKEEFSYIPSCTSANYFEAINNTATEDMSETKIIIGLTSKRLVNNMRTPSQGIFNNVSIGTLITRALEGTKPVVEQLAKDPTLESFILNPVSTRLQFLKAIEEQSRFYETDFRFFMDFDRSYLLSKKGLPVEAKDGRPKDIILNVVDATSSDGFIEGMQLTKDSYYININSLNAKLVNNQSRKDIMTNLVVIDEDTGLADLDLDYDTSVINSKTVYIRSKADADYIKNELEAGLSFLSISKSHVDPSLFKPNQRYSIKNFGDNSIYDGTYLILYKRVLYKQLAKGFATSIELGLQSIGKMNESVIDDKTGKRVYKSTLNKAIKNSTKRTTTASYKKTNEVKLVER